MKSSRPEPRRLKQFDCPVYGFQKTISGKYRLRILWDLREGPRRYGEIRQGLLTGNAGSKDVTPRVLSRELKALTTLGMIERKDFGTVPPKVEYALSAEGRSLVPVLSVMHKWGVQHLVREELLKKPVVRDECPTPNTVEAHNSRR